LIDHFELKNMFINILGVDDHYADSKVENGIQWMSELPYDKSEVLFVGDTAHDFEVADAIGIDCVLIPGGHQTKAVLSDTGATILDSLKDIRSLTAEKVV
jgi:phosphoglycolate phosphatase